MPQLIEFTALRDDSPSASLDVTLRPASFPTIKQPAPNCAVTLTTPGSNSQRGNSCVICPSSPFSSRVDSRCEATGCRFMLRWFFVSGLRVLLALQPRTTWQDAL